MESGQTEQAEGNITPEFSNSANRIVARVIKEGLWQEKITNPLRLAKIAEEERFKRPVDFDKKEISLDDTKSIEASARALFTDGVQNLVDEGIITPKMQSLTERLVQPEDISIPDGGEGGVNFVSLDTDDTVFPDSHEKKHKILLSKNIINNKYNILKDAAQKTGVSLPPESILKLAIGSAVLHEWSHSLERAIGIDYYQKLTHDSYYNDAEDGWKALSSRHNVVWYEAKKVSASAIDIKNPKMEAEIHRERFATGFEFENTREMLLKEGVPSHTAEQMVGSILSSRLEKLDEFKRIRASSNFSDNTLHVMLTDINSAAKEQGLGNVVTTPWSGFGYDAPYSKNELTEMLSQAFEKLETPQARKSILDEEKATFLLNPAS